MIKKTNWVFIALFLSFGFGRLLAAPLFPDVPENHWAKDAVAALVAKGLVEGYPDGTFKGDRAASRWETAMIVSRLLAKMEQAHATFATKAEFDDVRKLANALREELDALGVRVAELETNVGRIDKRVTELERISFYGSLDTRVVFQSFSNDGASDNDSNRGGAGTPGTVPYLNFDNTVGSRIGPPLRPQLVGFFPVVDYRLGKALTNGTGLTSKAILGLNIKVSPDIDAGLEFAAFSTQGDQIVDAYWGVSAPYLSNVFTGNAATSQSLDNAPFTRMNFNQFWLLHKPSHSKLVIGALDKTGMDPLVYAGQGNLGVFGPRRFPGFGFDVSGETSLAEDQAIRWEVLGTRFGDGVRFQGQNYQNYVLSGHLDYDFHGGGMALNFSRMAEEAPSGGQSLVVGLDNNLNVAYGASNGWSVRQWVNPPGYFALQQTSIGQSRPAVFPNTVDTRPIAGWNPTSDNAVGFGPGAGNFGPESQSILGWNGHFDIPLNQQDKVSLSAKVARSDFRANRNSSYNSKGWALAFDCDAHVLDGNLDLGASYLKIDPNYAPSAWFGNVLGGRPVKPFNFSGVFHLHDSSRYPQNREGLRLRGKWKFHHGDGSVFAKGSILRQTQTSLYDVRVNGGAVGPSIPTNDVIGFSPGFVDPVFLGFAHPNIYGAGTANSFDGNLSPLENPRGYENFANLGASYHFADLGLTVTGSASRNSLRRDSGLSATLGGSQNEVDVKIDSLSLDLTYALNSKLSLNTGADLVHAFGHFDPAGLYNAYAVANGSTDFRNLDSQQTIPHLGFEMDLTESTQWSALGRYYSTRDKVDLTIQPARVGSGQVGSSTHPFAWSGWQVSSEFQVKF